MTVAHQAHSELDVQVAALTTRVHGIEEGQRGIITTLNGLATKIDARGATNWGVIATFCGVSIAGATLIVTVLTVIGGLVYGQVKSDQERISSAIVKMDDRFMPGTQILHEIGAATSVIRSDEDHAAKGIDRNTRAIEANADDVKRLRDSVVPRGEHEQHWKADDQRFTDIQRQVDEVKHAQSGLYDARDVIHDLNERTHQLEARPEACR